MRADTTRAPLRSCLAVGLVAGSTLALQVLLTRIFSAALFYHFAFFAISLALLGTGAGAILLYLRPGVVEGSVPPGSDPVMNSSRRLAMWSAVYAALLLVVPALLVRLDYSFEDLTVDAPFVLTLALAAVLAALPFLAAGIVIALAIKTWVAGVGRVYAFDLGGAGLGALVIVPLLWLVDAPTLVVALGGVGAVAALLFAGPARAERRLALGLAAVGTLLVVLPRPHRSTGSPAPSTRCATRPPSTGPPSAEWSPIRPGRAVATQSCPTTRTWPPFRRTGRARRSPTGARWDWARRASATS